MANARTEKQKVKGVTDRLEEGLKELSEGEKYESYLDTMSKFHNYSANNIRLIEMQCSDAIYAAGYKAWQKNSKRHVNRDGRGIRILVPSPYKIKEEQEKIDLVTNELVLDWDGTPVVEEVGIKISASRVVTVFDYSQTDGEELPELGVNELQGSVKRYRGFMEALAKVSPVLTRYEGMEGDRKGYFIDLNHPTVIEEGTGKAQTAKTGVHEVAHAKFHAKEVKQEAEIAKDRETEEVEAESTAYTVCQHFRIDTSDYPFGYIAGWSSGKEMPELKSSLDMVYRTSSELIKGIEAQLLEIDKERAAEQAQENIILLVVNTDRLEYDLLSVRGMERTELLNSLHDVKDDDRQSVEAYLERVGAQVTLLENERSEEVEEHYLNYVYNTDAYEITDFKALQEEGEKANKPIECADVVVRISTLDSGEYETIRIINMQSEVQNTLYDLLMRETDEEGRNVSDCLREKGFDFVPIMRSGGVNDGYPQFFDFDMDSTEEELHIASEFPTTVQAEQFINRTEFYRSVHDSDERNLIMNHAYKPDDMHKTTFLAHSFAEQKGDLPPLWEAIRVAEEEVEVLPDGMVRLSEIHEYGYSWDEVLPLTRDKASELFGKDVSVYQLYLDGSETLVEDKAALQGHDGLFGVEKNDWNSYLEYQSIKQRLEDSEPNREAQLLYGNEGRSGIYQFKDTEKTRDIRFTAMDYLEMKDIPVFKENYTLIYAGELREGVSLEDIYTRFNIDYPADFTGHSLSVSDVVVLHQDGENTSHYIDSVGYREISESTKELSVSAEISSEKSSIMGEAAEENVVAEPDNDRVSYYVIEDLSTWAENSSEKSKLERFDGPPEAITKFAEYQGKNVEDKPDMVRATSGFNVSGNEFDLIHVRNHESCLPLDFTHSKVARESSRFMGDLQTLYHEVGFGKVRVHRETLPEEIKDFVKQRFEYQLKSNGLDDASLYMDRSDTLYEQGKMEHLIPTANQRHIVEDVPFMKWESPYVDTSIRETGKEETELAFQLVDRYISIREASEGYDYTVHDMDYRELDGGVHDNPDIIIRQALDEIVADLKELAHRSALKDSIQVGDELIPIDYDGLIEKVEQAEVTHPEEHIRNEVLEAMEGKVTVDFKARTEELRNGISGQTQEDIELTTCTYLQFKTDEYDMDIEFADVAVSGSRCRGLKQEDSDLDVVVEYRGGETEDSPFNISNEDGLNTGGVKVDINPTVGGKIGMLGQYLPGMEAYLVEKRVALQERNMERAQEEKQTVITLAVAECEESHNLGEYHEDTVSVEEAIEILNQIPPERVNGIRSIDINIHMEGTKAYEDTQVDTVSGRTADPEILDYVPDITDNPKVVAVIAELIDKLLDIEVLGSLEKWQAVFLAAEIGQLSYDYDTYQYSDMVEDREAQIANTAEDIRNRNTECPNDFLNATISDSMREGITDLFGRETEFDNSESVQAAGKVEELLDKLAEYKSPAKIEELEECNYDTIDNALNNEKPKKEKEHKTGRVPIKEKLAEKKAVIGQRDKLKREVSEKGTEKKSEKKI